MDIPQQPQRVISGGNPNGSNHKRIETTTVDSSNEGIKLTFFSSSAKSEVNKDASPPTRFSINVHTSSDEEVKPKPGVPLPKAVPLPQANNNNNNKPPQDDEPKGFGDDGNADDAFDFECEEGGEGEKLDGMGWGDEQIAKKPPAPKLQFAKKGKPSSSSTKDEGKNQYTAEDDIEVDAGLEC